MKEDFEIVRGSGNVFRDFGYPNADVEQTKAVLAAKIIGVLDDSELSTRKAEALTGVNHSEFARIRRVKLDRFTIDRLITILNRLNQRVEFDVRLRPVPEKDRLHEANHG
jgi:predicted XRE-type DNA-binding protein